MGSIYLTELANWLRAAGLQVVEYSNWKTRARGSGGYDSYPLCVMWHHTASGSSWDGQRDADYCTVQDSDAPLANLYINRAGKVWVCAAGATNTNGKGNSIAFSRGTVPQDSMNTRAVGVEMGNNGVGEQWPQAQVDAAFIVSNTVNAKLGNRPDDISTHQFYAPTRKVDPATTNVAGPWKPKSCTSSGTWDRSSIQAECLNRAGARPLPPQPPDTGGGSSPIPKDSDTMLRAGKNADSGNAYYIGDGTTATWVGGDDKKASNLLVCAGVIDVVSEKVVYSWSKVGAMKAADLKKYVGKF